MVGGGNAWFVELKSLSRTKELLAGRRARLSAQPDFISGPTKSTESVSSGKLPVYNMKPMQKSLKPAFY